MTVPLPAFSRRERARSPRECRTPRTAMAQASQSRESASDIPEEGFGRCTTPVPRLFYAKHPEDDMTQLDIAAQDVLTISLLRYAFCRFGMCSCQCNKVRAPPMMRPSQSTSTPVTRLLFSVAHINGDRIEAVRDVCLRWHRISPVGVCSRFNQASGP